MLTRIQKFDGWTAKREDEAAAGVDLVNWPAGSKMRQFLIMAASSPGAAMVVGCSAHSAMQVYVAAAAKRMGVPAFIYTAARAQRTAATQYAMDMGATVHEVRPAYLTVMRARAREKMSALKWQVVKWNGQDALKDTLQQCQNVPERTQRVVVPTGSGLQAGGVLAGLVTLIVAKELPPTKVLAVRVSNMATRDTILTAACKLNPLVADYMHLLEVESAKYKYDKWCAAKLPDGSVLDPYYAAKALEFVQPGDCLWVPGIRALKAMEKDCVEALGVALPQVKRAVLLRKGKPKGADE